MDEIPLFFSDWKTKNAVDLNVGHYNPMASLVSPSGEDHGASESVTARGHAAGKSRIDRASCSTLRGGFNRLNTCWPPPSIFKGEEISEGYPFPFLIAAFCKCWIMPGIHLSDPGPIRSNRIIIGVLRSFSATIRGLDRLLGLMADGKHFTPLANGNSRVSQDAQERESVNNELVPLATSFLFFGVCLNFYGMWNLKLGPENLWGVVALLIGIPCFMYGFDLFLDIVVKRE